ncbi:copper chaperone for superoxide dismutase isoform X2 [Parasteatoda tepidariorum]|uniref:copper chaperone for superoxide dismutase isoform X2 n=1 Tax=Parasteatoda tepidariorum TaxID=114398 RepID=UPI001C7271F1|nr:copper chaperone for superoxide dismutase isoform X2 [Parasteatoda tepidariorum]
MEDSKVISKIEFDVNLTCKNCANAVKNVLSKFPEVKLVECDIEKQSVVIETSLPSLSIKEAIESTGKRAVLKGFGSSSLGSAVAELKNKPIFGVIRFHQTLEDLCVIDGTIDGLPPGEHGLHVHEYGDLSDLPMSIGPHFNPTESSHGGQNDASRHYGDLGNIFADSKGRASFRIEDHQLKVHEIIGRSIAVSSDKDDFGLGNSESSKMDGNSGTRVTRIPGANDEEENGDFL